MDNKKIEDRLEKAGIDPEKAETWEIAKEIMTNLNEDKEISTEEKLDYVQNHKNK
jgi:hypothetical protein